MSYTFLIPKCIPWIKPTCLGPMGGPQTYSQSIEPLLGGKSKKENNGKCIKHKVFCQVRISRLLSNRNNSTCVGIFFPNLFSVTWRTLSIKSEYGKQLNFSISKLLSKKWKKKLFEKFLEIPSTDTQNICTFQLVDLETSSSSSDGSVIIRKVCSFQNL